MIEPRKKLIEIVLLDEFDGSLAEFKAHIEKTIVGVPDDARVEMYNDYDRGRGPVYIRYTRPETLEEAAYRIAREKSEALRTERLERAQLEQLRKKYGSGHG